MKGSSGSAETSLQSGQGQKLEDQEARHDGGSDQSCSYLSWSQDRVVDERGIWSDLAFS